MGSKASTQTSNAPDNVQGHTTKPESTQGAQPSQMFAQVFPNDAGAKYSGINPVTLAPGPVRPDQIPPTSLSFYADEEVDESRGLPKPACELAEAQIAYLAERTRPEDSEGADLDTDAASEPQEGVSGVGDAGHEWAGALDLPKSAENEVIVPHKGDKPHKDLSLKEAKERLVVKTWWILKE